MKPTTNFIFVLMAFILGFGLALAIASSQNKPPTPYARYTDLPEELPSPNDLLMVDSIGSNGVYYMSYNYTTIYDTIENHIDTVYIKN